MTTEEANADRALSLILDDEELSEALTQRAKEICGRGPDGEEDAEWWTAMTKATDELLAKAQQLNSGQTH